jgi:hypothetical protein
MRMDQTNPVAAGRIDRRRLRCASRAALGAMTLVAACGGGGGYSSPPPPNLMSAPGAAALNAYFQANHSTMLNTTYNGSTYTVRQDLVLNSGTTTFENMTVNSETDTATLSKDGVVVSQAVETDYFTVNPFALAGSVASNGTEYEVVQSFTPLPTTITVGQSGTLANSTVYHDNTKTVTDATVAATWSVQADAPTSVELCLTAVTSAVSGNPDGVGNATQVSCYHVTSSGSATLFKVTVMVNGVTLTFQ